MPGGTGGFRALVEGRSKPRPAGVEVSTLPHTHTPVGKGQGEGVVPGGRNGTCKGPEPGEKSTSRSHREEQKPDYTGLRFSGLGVGAFSWDSGSPQEISRAAVVL